MCCPVLPKQRALRPYSFLCMTEPVPFYCILSSQTTRLKTSEGNEEIWNFLRRVRDHFILKEEKPLSCFCKLDVPSAGFIMMQVWRILSISFSGVTDVTLPFPPSLSYIICNQRVITGCRSS